MITRIKWILFAIFIFGAFGSNEFDVEPKTFTQNGIQIVIADDDLHGFKPGHYILIEDSLLRDKPTINNKTGSVICGEIDKDMEIQVIKVLRVFETDEMETKKRIRGQLDDKKWLTLYDIGNDIEFINFPEEKRRKQNQDEQKYAAVLLAVQKADKEIVSSLLNEFSEEEKQKLTEYLIKKDKNKVLYFAIRHGYMLNQFGKEEKDKLIVSAEYKNDLIAYVEKEDEWKSTALHYASYLGHEQNVKLLLNAFDQEKNKEQLIEYLCKGNKYEQTALHLACRSSNDQEIIKLLLNAFGTSKEENTKRIEYVMKENDNMETALHLASELGCDKNVKVLLNAFDNKEKLIEYLWKGNKSEQTALHLASRNKNKETLKLLLNAFGTSKEENKERIEYVLKESVPVETALHVASEYGHEQNVKLLLSVFDEENEKLIAYLMKKARNNKTALHLASMHGYKDIVKLLLDAFSEEEKKERIEYLMMGDGHISHVHCENTVLHLASKHGHEEIVKLLLDVFVEEEPEKIIEYVLKENKDKETSLFLASQNGHEEIEKVLSQNITDAQKQIL